MKSPSQSQKLYKRPNNDLFPLGTTPRSDKFRITLPERLKTNPNPDNQSRRINELSMENQRLRHEIELLQKRLKELELNNDLLTLKNKLEQVESESNARQTFLLSELSSLDKKLSKLNVMFQNVRSQNQRLESEAKGYQVIFEENNTKLEYLTHSNSVLIDRTQRYREIAQMQKEDSDSRMEQVKEQLKLAEKAREKLRKLQFKVDRILIEKSKEVEIWQNPHFEREAQNVSNTVEIFSRDRSFFRQMVNQINEQMKLTRGSTLIIPNAQVDNYYQRGDIPLEKLKLFYPSFLSFIEHQKKTLENELANIAFKKPSVTFFPTMRYILDAKWNEIVLSEQKQSITRFPEFVYGWLNTFVVDAATRKVRSMNDNELSRPDEFVIRLVLDLTNPLTNKSWDCVTFKELLHDFVSQDEIYFYLFCRNLLYRGPQMLQSRAAFEAIHYVPLPYVEFVIDHVLRTQEQQTLYQVKKCIRDKSVKKVSKKNLYIVDGSFVLRVLLEMYREERKNRYLILKNHFNGTGTGSSTAASVPFKTFKRIISLNFPYTTETETATLYRESFSYGLVLNIKLRYQYQRVGVTVDTFFAVCSDNGFFCKHLNLQPMIKHPIMGSDGKILYDQNNMEYLQLLQAIERFEVDKENCVALLETVGSETMLREFQWFYEKYVMNEFKEELCINYYKEKSFLLIVHDFSSILAKVRVLLGSQSFLQQGLDANPKAMDFLKSKKEELQQLMKGAKKTSQPLVSMDNFYGELSTKESFPLDIDTIPVMVKGMMDIPVIIGARIAEEKKDYFKRAAAVKKLQKLVRGKLTKFYSFISSLLSARLKSQVRGDKK